MFTKNFEKSLYLARFTFYVGMLEVARFIINHALDANTLDHFGGFLEGTRLFLVFYLALICLRLIFRPSYQPQEDFEGFLYLIWKKEKIQEFFKDVAVILGNLVFAWIIGWSTDPFYSILIIFISVGVHAHYFKKNRNFSIKEFVAKSAGTVMNPEDPTANILNALSNLGVKHPELQYRLLRMVANEIMADFDKNVSAYPMSMEENLLYYMIKENRIYNTEISFKKNFEMLLKISEGEGVDRMIAISNYVNVFSRLG